jgi:hypothetical protein
MDTPSKVNEIRNNCPITLRIGKDLILPELPICRGQNRSRAISVIMPKTPIYKDYRFVSRQYYIRLAGKPSIIFSISKSLPKKIFSDFNFGLGFGAGNPSHYFTSTLLRKTIRHFRTLRFFRLKDNWFLLPPEKNDFRQFLTG